ncbi:MAG TPA: FtsX-like permease family protein, partial [Terriglobia bacterium]|nr:FtsX-like permease family protein [Terriglobia bacterium]
YTFAELVDAHLQQERMLTALSICFAGIALLLTGLGLYGLLARSVLLRTREIGLRMALGARPRDALIRVAWQGSRLVLSGAVAGLAAALVLSRLLRSLLFGVETANPIMLAGAAGVLLVVVVGAASIPAIRATRVDPMEALRCE